MFLNYIKNFFTKKIVKNSLANVKLIPSTNVIKTVGIIFDETYFYEREALVQELVKNSIQEKEIKVLVFKNKIKKKRMEKYGVLEVI